MLPAQLLGATSAVASSSIVSLIAQQAASTNPNGLVTITSYGATGSAVGALVWIATMMVKGKLVARNTAEESQKLAEALQASNATNKELVELVRQGVQREERMWAWLEGRGKGHAPQG